MTGHPKGRGLDGQTLLGHAGSRVRICYSRCVRALPDFGQARPPRTQKSAPCERTV